MDVRKVNPAVVLIKNWQKQANRKAVCPLVHILACFPLLLHHVRERLGCMDHQAMQRSNVGVTHLSKVAHETHDLPRPTVSNRGVHTPKIPSQRFLFDKLLEQFGTEPVNEFETPGGWGLLSDVG
jgi:hypothetical protein